MEQNFPKHHGAGANLEKLLMKCFQTFKDKEEYKNDVRFVRLWVKYIEMNSDHQKRAELYQLICFQGIGLRCAEFYKNWALEYQSAGDWKQAYAINLKGFDNMAQAEEEFKSFHETFLAALYMHLHN